MDTFITHSSRLKHSGPKQWVLVRSPSEPITGPPLSRVHGWWPEQYPDESDSPFIEPFETGFLNASIDSLQKFVRQHSQTEPDEALPRQRPFFTSHEIFAVLDSRSARDGTALVYHYHERMPKEYLEEDEDAYDEKVLIKEWVEWRVKFLTAAIWASVCDFGIIYADFEVRRDQYIDKEGVLQLPQDERHGFELPGLAEREMAAWGPELSQEEKDKAAWRFAESPFVDLVDAGVIKVYRTD